MGEGVCVCVGGGGGGGGEGGESEIKANILHSATLLVWTHFFLATVCLAKKIRIVFVFIFLLSPPGPKVISKTISLSSIQELSSVLRRPPVLWDNLHANDYDQRRLFLGPYSGRSVSLRPHLNGILTNPNCEFSANYVAIHTLAQWSRSSLELCKKPSPTQQAFQLEVEGQANEFDPSDEAVGGGGGAKEKGEKSGMEVHLYEPVKALEVAMKEWLQEFRKAVAHNDHYLPVKNAFSIAKANEFEELGGGTMDQDDIGQQDDDDPISKRVDPAMDPKLSEVGPAVLVADDPFGYEDLRLLVDFFYLPHQHGERAMRVLEEFCWLKENSPGEWEG